MREEVRDFDFESLRHETIKYIDLIKESNNFETIKDKIVCLWKNIPVPNLSKEREICISNVEYKHSEKTSLYLIIHYLIEEGYIDVVNEFKREYKGKEAAYVSDCIQNHLVYDKILTCMKNGDFSLFDNFMSENDLCDEVKFYHKSFFLCSDEREALGILMKEISEYMPRNKDKCK